MAYLPINRICFCLQLPINNDILIEFEKCATNQSLAIYPYIEPGTKSIARVLQYNEENANTSIIIYKEKCK